MLFTNILIRLLIYLIKKAQTPLKKIAKTDFLTKSGENSVDFGM